jgi:N6-L-threonylcarbamoyladenine synthase
MTLILGIESSCDETAAAVVRDGVFVLGQRVASQVDLHARFGGVIPEIASRSHLEAIVPVIEESLDDAGVSIEEIDAIAVTVTPGLVGCLLVGLSTAKGLALAADKPIVPVNHVHAHIHGALMPWMEARAEAGEPHDPPAPLAALVVSGGHTSLYAWQGPADVRLVGRTIDDAAGEAYDKVSAMLGLGYPGGPVIDKLAQQGNPKAHAFPRTRAPNLDFSFSGLKTAVLYKLRGPNARRGAPMLPGIIKEDVAASFQAAAVDILATRLVACAEQIGARGLVVCGGVAANSALRARAATEADRLGLPLFLPTPELATDNAVMIAGLGHWLHASGRTGDLSTDVLARTD